MKSNLSTANSQFIVYGLDETGKAKAGRFTHKESDAAKEAAASMKLNIREVVPPQADDLLKQIPPGRIHAKGKAFIAYVKRELYDQVIAEIGQHLAEPQSGENPLTLSLARTKADQASALPTSWDSIAPGHLVLLQESLPAGWYEAIVVARDNEQLTLRLRDYPKYPTFHRHIHSVGLLHPGL